MRKFEVTVEKVVQICAAMAAFAFLVTGVVYLYLGSWTVTHYDFWRTYEFYFGHSWLETAALKFNYHSLFFPSFFWLASVKFFHGSQQPLVFAGLALLFITAALLLVTVWRDETVGFTAKIVAMLVVIVGNFWMGRWAITLSGGFNSQNSLTMAGVTLALLLMPKASRLWPMLPIIICAGFVASFSCGQGFAIWPTLLLLAWCLRLRWSSVVTIGASTLAAMVIYELLPPHSEDYRILQETGSAGITLVAHLCGLLGSPVPYAAAAWHGGKTFIDSNQASTLALWSGMVGLVLAGVAVIPRMVRRDPGKSSLQIAGLGLVIFNVGAMIVIIVGRAELFRLAPSDVLAPRYLFWSSLFWTGLLLFGIQRAEHLRWGRSLIIVSALATTVFAWPEHYRVWFQGKFAQCVAKEAATAVINGVVDDNHGILTGDLTLIAGVAPQLRAHRLDMFADGLQDWIGLAETSLFGGRHKPERLIGNCRVVKLVQCDNGAPAARVVGQAIKKRHVTRIARWAITPVSWIVGQEIKKGYVTPKELVIVDPTGVVRGVARSSPVSPFINRVFYQGKFSTVDFLGYIRDYNPQLHYAVRSADDRSLSEGKIPVQVGMTNPAKP
jgi:hypothetical protein